MEEKNQFMSPISFGCVGNRLNFYLAFMGQFLSTTLNQEVNDLRESFIGRVNKGRFAKLKGEKAMQKTLKKWLARITCVGAYLVR